MNAKKKPRQEATCSYCGQGLGCLAESVRDREYWSNHVLGLRMCDACLLNQPEHTDKPTTERLIALRLAFARGINLDVIDATIDRARGIVEHRQLRRLILDKPLIFELHEAGEFVAAMWAGQSLWNAVNHLADAVDSRKVRAAGMKTVLGGKKSAEARKRNKAPSPKRAAILDAQRTYKGSEGAMVGYIARTVGASRKYVGMVLGKSKTGNSNS